MRKAQRFNYTLSEPLSPEYIILYICCKMLSLQLKKFIRRTYVVAENNNSFDFKFHWKKKSTIQMSKCIKSYSTYGIFREQHTATVFEITDKKV